MTYIESDVSVPLKAGRPCVGKRYVRFELNATRENSDEDVMWRPKIAARYVITGNATIADAGAGTLA